MVLLLDPSTGGKAALFVLDHLDLTHEAGRKISERFDWGRMQQVSRKLQERE